MKNVKEHLEIAYADAMYRELYITAGLIAAALETLGVVVDGEDLEDEVENSDENVVCFPDRKNT